MALAELTVYGGVSCDAAQGAKDCHCGVREMVFAGVDVLLERKDGLVGVLPVAAEGLLVVHLQFCA